MQAYHNLASPKEKRTRQELSQDPMNTKIPKIDDQDYRVNLETNMPELDKLIEGNAKNELLHISREISVIEKYIDKIDIALTWTFPNSPIEISSQVRDESVQECSYHTGIEEFGTSLLSNTEISESQDKSERMVLCGTGLTSSQLKVIASAASKMGCEYTKDMDDSVTHLITVTKNGKASRTVKYILGIAQHCWILDMKWVSDSLTQGEWLDEEDFEVTCDQYGYKNGPKISRLSKSSLFNGMDFYLATPFKDGPSKAEVSKFIQKMGGKVTYNLSSTCVVLYHEREQKKKAIQIQNQGFITVSHQWLVDSISEYSIKSYREYTPRIERM